MAPLRNTQTGELLTEPKEKASLLNAQFQSVFSSNTPLRLKHLCQAAARHLPAGLIPGLDSYPTMPEFTISVNGIKKMLATLKPHKAAGPDKIRPLVLKELREAVAPILQLIYTRSLDTGELPKAWKTANVVPIFKKGSKHLAVDYRTVSLTCICCKVMEHILVGQIARHLVSHHILNSNQHAFRKGMSCETLLSLCRSSTQIPLMIARSTPL